MAYTAVVKDAERQSLTTDGPPESSVQTDATTPTTPPISGETDRLPEDVLFGSLSNERRRRILRYMDENGPETTLSDLAEHVASIENDKPVAAITSSERKRLYVGLYQCHLPKLDDANVIDYNQPSGTVELRAGADQLLSTESLAIELFHYQLLKLAEADFISWDRDRSVVRRGPYFNEIAPLIDLLVVNRDDLPAGWL